MAQDLPRQIFLAPSYSAFGKDKLFDASDPRLNRDDALLPTVRLRNNLLASGADIHTDDYLLDLASGLTEAADYYSFGILRDYDQLCAKFQLNLRAFVIFEPPLVARKLYDALPSISRHFARVYLHNTHGDGYSLEGVDQTRLHKLFWPQPYDDVIERYWTNNDRACKLVVINGNHNPLLRLQYGSGELYSARIRAMAELSKLDAVDLYGRGWSQWWHPNSMWLPYWQNYGTLMRIYKGSCLSKYEVLGRYRFCLCIENLTMDGYITEKIFDCLYAGTIPVYIGPKDIDQYVPREAYLDARQYRSWTEMWEAVRHLDIGQIARMKEAGRSFIKSPAGRRYFESLDKIFSQEPSGD